MPELPLQTWGLHHSFVDFMGFSDAKPDQPNSLEYHGIIVPQKSYMTPSQYDRCQSIRFFDKIDQLGVSVQNALDNEFHDFRDANKVPDVSKSAYMTFYIHVCACYTVVPLHCILTMVVALQWPGYSAWSNNPRLLVHSCDNPLRFTLAQISFRVAFYVKRYLEV